MPAQLLQQQVHAVTARSVAAAPRLALQQAAARPSSRVAACRQPARQPCARRASGSGVRCQAAAAAAAQEEAFGPQVCVVLGTQWGDEGKGKLVDILAQDYEIVARAQVRRECRTQRWRRRGRHRRRAGGAGRQAAVRAEALGKHPVLQLLTAAG
jgi:hypothetical protein